jgi:hypothetical protein
MITADKLRDGVMTLTTLSNAELFSLYRAQPLGAELKDMCAMEIEVRYPFNQPREK